MNRALRRFLLYDRFGGSGCWMRIIGSGGKLNSFPEDRKESPKRLFFKKNITICIFKDGIDKQKKKSIIKSIIRKVEKDKALKRLKR